MLIRGQLTQLGVTQMQGFKIILGCRSLNISQKGFKFGIKDVIMDTEQLANEFSNYIYYGPKNGG